MKPEATIDAVVERLRAAGVDIRSIAQSPWIEDVEQKLGLRFPRSYRALITRYAFPLLEFDLVELFANEGDGSDLDLTVALFRDPYMSPWLASHRLIHIGHPYIGNYDPICLDLASHNPSDPAVVRLDHEDILCERKKVHRTPIAPTLIELLQKVQIA